MPARARVEEKPRRLAGARGQHHHPGLHLDLLPGGGVDVGHARGAPLVVGRHLPGHGPGDHLQPAGREGRGKEDGGHGEVGVGGAASTALPAVVAGRASVVGPGDDREARGNAGNAGLPRRLLDQALVAAGLRRGQEDAVGLVLEALVGAEEPHQALEPVVVGGDVVVGDRPVVPVAVAAAPLEVPGAEPQRDAAPVVRPATEHAPAKPAELLALLHRVGLAGNVPASVAGVELPEGPGPVPATPPRRVVVPGEHVAVLLHVPLRPGLEEHDLGPGLGEDLRRHPPAGPRADDAHVPRLSRPKNLHGGKATSLAAPCRVVSAPCPHP